jgi:hypothetical protein
MFDIKEYYNYSNYRGSGAESDILDIGYDIVSEIDDILGSSGGNLYISDRYKSGEHMIEIFYPAAGYPGPQAFVPTPDRIRFFLSFYPYKEDFRKIDRIVLRPRYVETGNVELAALYLKKQRALVLYLTHPCTYSVSGGKDNSRFISISIESLMDNKIIEDTINKSNKAGGKDDTRIPSLWDIIALADPYGEGVMDKFFIKWHEPDDRVFKALNDISLFYSGRGY